MADVGHEHVADLVTREQMAATNTAEGHREIGSRGAVDDAAQQVHAGWPVHRDERNLEVEQPFEQRRQRARAAARSRRSRAAHPPRGRQWATGHPARPRARLRPSRAGPCARVSSAPPSPAWRRHPHRHIEPVEGARQHPAVTAVVPVAGRDEHALRQPRRRIGRPARRRPRGRPTPSAWPARCRRRRPCDPRRRIGRGSGWEARAVVGQRCHPERSEGGMRRGHASFASLRMPVTRPTCSSARSRDRRRSPRCRCGD